MNRAVRELAQRIESWRTAEVRPDSISASCQQFPIPDVRAVTGTTIGDAVKPEKLLSLFVVIGFLSGIFASFLGLLFEGIFFGYDADFAIPYNVVSGWYAVLCSLALFLLLMLPLVLARKAIVSLTAAARANPPPPRPSAPIA
jgi:hypothetical protein